MTEKTEQIARLRERIDAVDDQLVALLVVGLLGDQLLELVHTGIGIFAAVEAALAAVRIGVRFAPDE